MKGKWRYYLKSFRLRTLPLSVSGILTGSLLARQEGEFRLSVFCLALLTTLCLQILSNLANELGDIQKGTDNANRLGPIRSIQSGVLSIADFHRMIRLFVGLSLTTGLVLIFTAFRNLLYYKSLLMLGIGGAALWAAIRYTMGKNPYGYRGWGDLFVFLFFGPISTLGAYFLMTGRINGLILLPAAAIGLLSSGVLNINNIRDLENDRIYQKKTFPVRIGEKKAKIYHTALITGAQLCLLVFACLTYQGISNFLFLLTGPLFCMHLHALWLHSGKALDSQLKFLSLTTLLLALLTGWG